MHREILAVEPERLLEMPWRNGPPHSTVTWRLERIGTAPPHAADRPFQ
jgi:hypothetical protein